MEYYSTIKNEILPFITAWMDLKGTILSEMSQMEMVKKSHLILLICGI